MAQSDKEGACKVCEECPSDLPDGANLRRNTHQMQVGFDCEFLERPKELQTDCPICLHILREPYQATCCGYIYCRRCIEHVQTNSKPCPTCNNKEFTIFPDKRLHKSLYGFKVWCGKREIGCNWSGELRDYFDHLNPEPSQENLLAGCEYCELECILCGDSIWRRNLEKHKRDDCKQRPYICPLCEQYNSAYVDVVENHQPKCLFQRVPCPNGCGISPEKRNLENHLKNDCQLKCPDKVPCEFSFAGCTDMIPPDKMQEHLEGGVKTHLSLMAASFLNLRKRLIQLQEHFDENDMEKQKIIREKIEMQEQFQKEIQEVRELRLEINRLKTRQEEDRQYIELLQSHSSIVPVTYTLDDYNNRRARSDMGWSSAPFYTDSQGYKMCLWVDIGGNGQGKDVYMSVFISIMKGDYDAKLRWPFRGSVIVQLLNQRDEESHFTEVIKYHKQTPISTSGRVMEDGRKSKPWGKGKFMKHDDLKTGGFIKNDMLKFRVFKIKLDD